MICKPESKFSKKLTAFCIEKEDFDPHLLGIVLHIIADTWSHQGFSGMLSKVNNIQILETTIKKAEKEDTSNKTGWQKFLAGAAKFFAEVSKSIVLDNLTVGHAEAETYPDLPWIDWKYKTFKSEDVDLKNVDICMSAINEIEVILKKVISKFPDIKSKEVTKLIPIKTIKEKFTSIIEVEGEDRHNSWLTTLLHENYSEKPVYINFEKEEKPVGLIGYHKGATQVKTFVLDMISNEIFVKGYYAKNTALKLFIFCARGGVILTPPYYDFFYLPP